MKPKLHIAVMGARHFLRWELEYFARDFILVDQPSKDALLLAFGPDALEAAAGMPALRRAAMLFPGFGCNPYHNLEYRARALTLLEQSYDLALVNPGPLQVAYASYSKLTLCPFSVDVRLAKFRRARTSIRSLLHASADSPQKDWSRSERVMQLTGLPYEVFPPRDPRHWRRRARRFENRLRSVVNRGAAKAGFRQRFPIVSDTYFSHATCLRRCQQYDAFVHVAADVGNLIHLDGKYTATLMEAGLTGAILFWHDTFKLGNDFETVFHVPADPALAAARILEVRREIDVASHSRRTREEMLDRFSPEQSVAIRCRALKALV